MGLLVKEPDVAGQISYGFFLQNAAGTLKLLFEVSDDGTAVTDSVVSWTPSTATWYHVAVAYDTGGNVLFYVNGAQQGATQTGAKTSIFDGNSRLGLGVSGATGTPNSFLDGNLDDARVYNTNRTAGAILGDYAQKIIDKKKK